MKRADLIFGLISIILAYIAMALAAQDVRDLTVVARSVLGDEVAIGRQIAVITTVDKYRKRYL